MKNKIKRMLSLLLSAIMLFGVLSASAFAAEEEYKVGDIITFGAYPQSKVTDEQIINTLTNNNPVDDTWISYGYYSGTGQFSDGNMVPSDYMKYKDVTYNSVKYRGVYFTAYRPYWTSYASSSSNSPQDDNGYYTNTAYWFKYEPLTWRVLDPSEGFVMCSKAIDSQAYQNFVYKSSNYYNSKTCTNYASDWATSSIREWLNDDFYNTAFNDSEKLQIGASYLENKSTAVNIYNGSDTYDKIFLLSYWDVLNSSYGFNSSSSEYDKSRQLKSTDYAQAQGCYKSIYTNYNGNTYWRLRSPHSSNSMSVVGHDGYVYSYDYGYGIVDGISNGIVPAFRFNQTHIHNYISAVTPPTCTDKGYTTHTCTCGDSYVDTYVDATGHTYGEWGVTTPATCTSSGVENRSCINCEHFQTRETNKIDHSYNTAVTPPTCTDKGYTTHTCTCGDSYVDTYVDATGHTYGEWGVTSAPTTLLNGVETCYCQNCDFYQTRPVDKLTPISAKLNDISTNYKKVGHLEPQITNPDNVSYTVDYKSSNPNSVIVDSNGNYFAVKTGSAKITCTLTDEYGNITTTECNINVKYNAVQWIIMILLFGWLWY